MLNDLIAHVAKTNGLTDAVAQAAVGIVFNTADRQAAPFSVAVFKAIPGARTLAARTGSDIGAPTGEIARLIEQTPGGRRIAAQGMISALHAIGLDHKAIGHLLPTISAHMDAQFGLKGFGHLGDLLGSDLDADVRAAIAA
jgi:hypothetical protein